MTENPNVLLLVFDALRPNYLSCYGGNAARVTPSFDDIATNGTLFENAFTVGRNTPTSHGTMFTGKYPSETGLVGGFRSVPEDVETLAEYTNKHGYDTFAVSRRTGNLNSDLDHDRGFDKFLEPDREDMIPSLERDYLKKALTDPRQFRELLFTLYRGPDKLTNLKFDLLLDHVDSADAPFFGFINQLTTHGPYRPPRPHMNQIMPSYNEPRMYLSQIIGEMLGIETRSLDHPGVSEDNIFGGGGFRGHNLDDKGWVTDAELTMIRHLYGGLVDYLDSQLGVFLNSLKEMDEFENTVLILTADHGEHLGEHDVIGHSHFLYDEVMQVPLIMAGPGVPEGESRTDLVSLIDLFDTVCDLCNLPAPDNTSGHSMFSSEERDAVFAEYGIRDAKSEGFDDVEAKVKKRMEAGRKCVRTDEYKYVFDSNGNQLLYSLPHEKEIIDPNTEIIKTLHRTVTETLGTEFKEKRYQDEVELGEQSLENLRELGYIE